MSLTVRDTEDLARPRLRTDPSGDVHGEAGEIVTAPFALTRVDAGAHREPRGAGRLDDRDRGRAPRSSVHRTSRRSRRPSC